MKSAISEIRSRKNKCDKTVRLVGHIYPPFQVAGVSWFSRSFVQSLGSEPEQNLLCQAVGSFVVCFFHLTATLTESHILSYAVGAFSGHFFTNIWRFVVNE